MGREEIGKTKQNKPSGAMGTMRGVCSLCPGEGGRGGKEGKDPGLGQRGLWGQVWLGTGCPKKDPRPRSFLGNYYSLMENFPDASKSRGRQQRHRGETVPVSAMP